MIRLSSLLFFSLLLNTVFSQIRLDKLEILPKQEYKIAGSDVLVVDTLMMRDSSRIFLNRDAKENIINAKMVVIGKGCVINGRGKSGLTGKVGAAGNRQNAPCRNADAGKDGEIGKPGSDGLNLSFYSSQLKIEGSLTIDLNGGDGGNGGRGGKGGDGGPGTKLCKGGNGGDGGNGGNGAVGGNGGKLQMTCKTCTDLYTIQGTKLVFKNYGGFAGSGGIGGIGGQAGLGSAKDGKNGKRGIAGLDGVAGKPGAFTIEQK
jgi:hypothetical protein